MGSFKMLTDTLMNVFNISNGKIIVQNKDLKSCPFVIRRALNQKEMFII